MILVDTSIWIELLARRPRHAIVEGVLLRFATCGPVVQEVLQGLRKDPPGDALRAVFLAIPVLSDRIPLRLFISAGEIYQRGRKMGITIRSSMDCLIAAIAIDNNTPVWHRDRDFDAIAQFTELRLEQPAKF